MSANAATMLDGKDEKTMRPSQIVSQPPFEYRFHDINREGITYPLRQKEADANEIVYQRFLDDLRSTNLLRVKLQRQNTRPYWCGYDTAPQTLWNQQMTNAEGRLNDLVSKLLLAEPMIMAAMGVMYYMSFGRTLKGWDHGKHV